MPSKLPTFTLRLPEALRAELEERAAADGRSLANYVTRVLAAHVAGPSPEIVASSPLGAFPLPPLETKTAKATRALETAAKDYARVP